VAEKERVAERERKGRAGKHMSMVSLVAEADLMHKPYAHKPIQRKSQKEVHQTLLTCSYTASSTCVHNNLADVRMRSDI
jgi:hypothetical protein